LGNNINSNNFLEVLIAGVKLTQRVKYVSKCEGKKDARREMCKYFYCITESEGKPTDTQRPVCRPCSKPHRPNTHL